MQRFQKISNKVLDKMSKNKVASAGAGLVISGVNAFASPTDFATALPSSLLPSGFWTLVGLVFGLAVTIGGVVVGLRLLKRGRG